MTSPTALAVLRGHTGGLCDVAWSLDGALLATGGDDARLRLWSAATAAPACAPLAGHTAAVLALDWSPRGSLLASGSADESVRLWDPRMSAAVRVIPAHSEPVAALHFNADGTLLATGSYDGLMCVSADIPRASMQRTDDLSQMMVFNMCSPLPLRLFLHPNSQPLVGRCLRALFSDAAARRPRYARAHLRRPLFSKQSLSSCELAGWAPAAVGLSSRKAAEVVQRPFKPRALLRHGFQRTFERERGGCAAAGCRRCSSVFSRASHCRWCRRRPRALVGH